MAKKAAVAAELQTTKINVGQLTVHILGKTPIILNRISEKAKRELLMPKGRMSTADKKGNLKHDPMAEFRASPYTLRDDSAPTLLMIPAGAFKGAIASAALDSGGTTKAQTGRLTWIQEFNVSLYGVPAILMSITRSADMAHTPDVRTRAIVPRWACSFTVNFVEPILRAQHVFDLLGNAGLICGIGDWRQQKGSGSFGQFEIVQADDARYLGIVAEGGRAAQVEAMQNPECFDAETEEMLDWFDVESRRRGFKVVA